METFRFTEEVHVRAAIGTTSMTISSLSRPRSSPIPPMALVLPPRLAGQPARPFAGDDQQHLLSSAPGQGQPPELALVVFVWTGHHCDDSVWRSGVDGRDADVLLRAVGGACLSDDERNPVVGAVGPVHAQHAPLVGAPDGAGGDPAHGAGVLHRRVQAAARVQLDRRRGAAAADAGRQLHRLSAAVGSVVVLGDHGRHEHRRLRAGGGRISARCLLGGSGGRPKRAHPLLHAAHRRPAAADDLDRVAAPLAGAQRRRPGGQRDRGRPGAGQD